MQSDNHFYLTFLLACRVGIDPDVAEIIAWANQFTDECNRTGHQYGLETQTSNWEQVRETQYQATVLTPFHFVPGDSGSWVCEAGSKRCRGLVDAALATKDPIRLGIALHAFQDTWSHQGFSGWREDVNSCFPWYWPSSALPNVGHAELMAMPDVTNYIWTDPRTGKRVDNDIRFFDAFQNVYPILEDFVKPEIKPLYGGIFQALMMGDYGHRITILCRESPRPEIDYHEVSERLKKTHLDAFMAAAQGHLSDALASFKDLRRPKAEVLAGWSTTRGGEYIGK